MLQAHVTTILFAPTNERVRVQVTGVDLQVAKARIELDWWGDPALHKHFSPDPIDRLWKWDDLKIDYGGRFLEGEVYALATDDGVAQGAILISKNAVTVEGARGDTAFVLERLFIAPRNRKELRRDGRLYYVGVGTELLRWAARLSFHRGCKGRLVLDASPDSVEWYQRRGLKSRRRRHIVHEGVRYLPMMLGAHAARRLLLGTDV